MWGSVNKNKRQINNLDLYFLIESFLKSLALVQSASPLTLQAYWSDLQQAFLWPMEDQSPIWGPQPGQGFAIEGPAFVGGATGPHWSETDLLQQAKAAQHRWAPLAPSSRNRKVATLKSFFSWLYQEKYLSIDLSYRLKTPKIPQRLPHFISVDEVTAVLTTFPNEMTLKEHRKRSLFLLLYGGGLRVSEACRLPWTALSSKHLRILGKGQKERLVPFPRLAFVALNELRKHSDQRNEFIFGDHPLSPRVAYEWIRQMGHEAGLINSLHPHALRHSFATHLLSGGANLRTLQELLGHQSLRATEKYTHLSIDQLARTMEKTHPLGVQKKKVP